MKDGEITRLVARLLSRDASADTVVAAVRAAEHALLKKMGDAVMAFGRLEKRRERDRLQKQQRRATRGDSSRDASADTRKRPTLTLITTDLHRSVSGKGNVGVVGTKRPAARNGGIPLPVDWAPRPGHYLEAELRGYSASDVDRAAEAMRNWAKAEAHRAISRKADLAGWDACFLNTWLFRGGSPRGGAPRRKTFMDVVRS